MAHELEIIDGQAQMMYVREDGIPWHGMGTELDEAPTSAVAAEQAGLNWDVEKRPLWYQLDELDENGNPQYAMMPGRYATVRKTDQAPLGDVADEYVIFQNMDGFKLLDEVFAEVGIEVKYTTAGSLRGGKQVFMTARLPKEVTIGRLGRRFGRAGDVIWQYLMLTSGHDGRTALDITPTNIRPVCMNTVNAALRNRDQYGARLTHIAGLINNRDDIRRKLNLALKDHEDYVTIGRKLAEVKADDDTIEEVTSLFLPETIKLDITKAVRRSPGMIWNNHPDIFNVVGEEPVRRLVQTVFSDSELDKAKTKRAARLDVFGEVRKEEAGSLWGLWNATTGYLDHQTSRKGRSAEARTLAIMSGRPALYKQMVWNHLATKVGVTD